MNDRENLFGLLRRTGYAFMPVEFSMSPDLEARFKQYVRATGYKMPRRAMRYLPGAPLVSRPHSASFWRERYAYPLAEDTNFDEYGVAWESGSAAAMHMRRLRHPLAEAQTVEEIQSYPFPKFSNKPLLPARMYATALKAAGNFVIGSMQCTIWETAWYLRSMEALMMDMLCDEDMADAVLDVVTANACDRAVYFAVMGADGIYLGDDIGMQSSPMMSMDLYDRFLKPRLQKVIAAARAVRPDILVFYHSCGFVEPFIDRLIEVGVDVLNPVQPESMDFREIYAQYGDRISFCGTLGTQTLMPFGTPQEIRDFVWETLDMVGPKGGLLIAPTHLLEPEVPVENVIAYLDACKQYKVKK